jgi:HAD superfamily hydrolase (TIGR01493 family)
VSGALDVVFFDVGGPIYDDHVYAAALRAGLRRLGAHVDEADFEREYDHCRRAQAGFTRRIAQRFRVDADALRAAAAASWHYPPSALHADVLPALTRLAGRYAIGLLANQPAATRSALERDGVAAYVDHWVLSGDVGLFKPDVRLFAYAVEVAGCAPERAAYVGNRLDVDVRPACSAGMRAVWLLRGEAPPSPTAEQRAEADAVIRSLRELPAMLERVPSVAAR